MFCEKSWYFRIKLWKYYGKEGQIKILEYLEMMDNLKKSASKRKTFEIEVRLYLTRQLKKLNTFLYKTKNLSKSNNTTFV